MGELGARYGTRFGVGADPRVRPKTLRIILRAHTWVRPYVVNQTIAFVRNVGVKPLPPTVILSGVEESPDVRQKRCRKRKPPPTLVLGEVSAELTEGADASYFQRLVRKLIAY